MTNFCFCSSGELSFNGSIKGNDFIVGTGVYHLPSIPKETTGHIFIPEQCYIEEKPYNIRNFYVYAFFSTNITSITFSPIVESISGGILESCSNLTFADLSKTKIKEVYNYCFSRCINLNKVLLPITCTSLNTHSFCENRQLKELVIPYRVKTVHKDAFDTPWIENIYFCGTRQIETTEIASIKNVYVPYSYERSASSSTLFGREVTKRSFICYHSELSKINHCSSSLIHKINFFILIAMS